MLDAIWDFVEMYIDIRLLLSIVLLTAWARKFIKAAFVKIAMVYKVLVIALVLSVLFYYGFLLPEKGSPLAALICFNTYLAATTFYNLIYAPLENWIKTLSTKLGGTT